MKNKHFFYSLILVIIIVSFILFFAYYNFDFGISGMQVSNPAENCQNIQCIDSSGCVPYNAAFSENLNGYKSRDCTCDNDYTFSETVPCSLQGNSGNAIFSSPESSQESRITEGGTFEETFPIESLTPIRQVIVTDKETEEEVAVVQLSEETFDIQFVQEGKFYPSACSNGKLDYTETNLDCGGECRPCEPTLAPPVKKLNIWWSVFLIFVFYYLHVSAQNSGDIEETAQNNI